MMEMVSFVILAMLLPYTVAMGIREMSFQDVVDMEWMNFKTTYNKSYNDEWEAEMRRNIFSSNYKYIVQHNEEYTKGEKSYYLGINQFTDLTHEEFLAYYTSPYKPGVAANASTYLSPSNILLPTEVDWRQKGYVTQVKNQGRCGSCWAFSSTGTIEGQHKRKTGHLVSLSEQQLVDCSTENHGCQGGFMYMALEYVKENGGIEGESDYKYMGKQQSSCNFQKQLIKATVSGLVKLPEGSEPKLQEAVATVGPISVAIHVEESFQYYRGGVYDDPSCTESKLNHGVLVVGYGTESKDYWLVKNSWGPQWGEQGYIRMSRNKGNQCGIATEAIYPTV